MTKIKLIFILFFSFFLVINFADSKPTANGELALSQAKKSKKGKKRVKKRRRSAKASYSYYVPKGNIPVELKSDSLIFDGVHYKKYLFGKHKTKISTNVLEIDLNKKDLSIEILKAKNNISELDKLQEIIRFSDSTNHTNILGAVNASFWRAVHNNPIGPCIIDGNVIEMNAYKEWSSLFIDDRGEPFIDNFKLNGTVKLHNGNIVRLTNTNRRRDSAGIVFYNSFGGKVIPHVKQSAINKIVSESFMQVDTDSTFLVGDSTETKLSYEEFASQLIEGLRNDLLENSISKAVIEYIDKPSVNKSFRAVVNYIDTGSVQINDNQGVLSFGYYAPPDLVVYIGDTLEFMFSTDVHQDKEFMYACSATPRLVREGNASQEANFEGSKARRFIYGQLGRTSLGYSKDKDKLYLVTIDHSNSILKRKGTSLAELAQIMKQIGCYDAMNLDGGGSSIMVIDGKNIMAADPDASRRISVGIGVSVKE